MLKKLVEQLQVSCICNIAITWQHQKWLEEFSIMLTTNGVYWYKLQNIAARPSKHEHACYRNGFPNQVSGYVIALRNSPVHDVASSLMYLSKSSMHLKQQQFLNTAVLHIYMQENVLQQIQIVCPRPHLTHKLPGARNQLNAAYCAASLWIQL